MRSLLDRGGRRLACGLCVDFILTGFHSPIIENNLMLIRHPVLPRNINQTRHVVTNDEKRNCLVIRAPFDRFAKKFSIILYGLQCGILL
jgi:hypothetical protein